MVSACAKLFQVKRLEVGCAQVSANGVGKLRSIANQSIAHADQHQSCHWSGPREGGVFGPLSCRPSLDHGADRFQGSLD